MVTGWRRAFCTSIPKERETTVLTEKQQHCNNNNNNNQSPRFSTKFGFFSNPSTPRLQSQPISTSTLRCKTTTTTTPTSSIPNSPKLQCKTTTTTTYNNNNKSPRLFNFSKSNPSSPKSPSSFSLSLLKSTLRLSKTRCGICLQTVKTGQGTAVFTAECSHSFHFTCITAHVKNHHHHHHHHHNHHYLLICPVSSCGASWKELPLLSLHKKRETETTKTKSLRVYNDDEPLISQISVSHFNPIPESEETEEENIEEEFQGFFVPNNNNDNRIMINTAATTVQVSLLPDVAVVSVGRSYETYAMVLKLKAPPCTAARGARRAPIDLVAVVEVSGCTSGVKLQMMKRAMRLLISSLCGTDRLSIVAFSSSSKRLSPLRRMTANGRRSARRIVDALATTGQGMTVINVNDALKKAAKVLEDRRERNPVASIMLLSDGQNNRSSSPTTTVSTTRFSHQEIPVHALRFRDLGACNHAPPEDVFAKLVSGLLTVAVQDLRVQLGFVSGSAPAEIAGVYSLTGRPECLKSGSVRVGDLYGEEERELLVELKVPNCSTGAHHVMSVRFSLRDPKSQELIYSKEQSLLIPRPHTVRSSSNISRLRSLHVSTRAVAESKRLIERNDLSGAYHMLSSARALLMQSSAGSDEFLRGLEAELAEVQRRRQRQRVVDEKQQEQLTPTSAWRAAERLAKVAIMRKHMNRVSDLHGFENARF